MNKVEAWKSEKHGFDVWGDLESYAREGTAMAEIAEADLERMKWYGIFYRKRVEDGRYMIRVRIPGCELDATQARAVAAVREWNARLGPDATWLACSHGDVIKAVVADAMGLHLDQFQRIVVDPCSVTVIRYTELRPFVVRVNDTGGDVSGLIPPPKRRRPKASSDAVVGGGAGSAV